MPPSHRLGAVCLAAAVALALAVPAGAVVPNGRLQIIQLDVAQGDGAVLISPLGQVVLIDEGPSGASPVMGVSIVNQLKALGVTHVDYHFASHYHADHIGNIKAIVDAGIPIDYGWDRGGSYSSGAYTTYATTLGTKRRTLVKGQAILLDSLAAHPVTIRCVDLAGAGTGSSDENSLSVVLKVSYGEFDEVFGGDLQGSTGGGGANVESIVGPEVGPVEVYKVHHHGSKYSTNATWLNAITPKIGVISVGNGNGYGHPTSDAVGRLHTAGVHTYWTETGSGTLQPNPTWDCVANGQVIISATWEPAGVDSVRGTTGCASTFTNSGTGDAVPPVVAVTAPNGGEDWKAGSVHAITWTATDNVAVTAVDLAYSTDGGATFPYAIASGLANSGSYSWTVPNAPTATARVRAMARDAAGNTASDASNASFTISTWTIVASAGAGGSIAPTGSVAVAQGASQSFAVSPAPGYHVADVLVDGASAGAVPGYTFPNVTANHTIAASFAINTYTLAVAVTGSGAVTRSPDLPAYDHGAPVELTATPAAGWSFVAWGGDAGGNANPLTLTMDANQSVTASFAPLVVVVAPTGGESVVIGTTLDIRWTAPEGVVAVDVLISRNGVEGPYDTLAVGLPNTGSYPWIVAGPETGDGFIKLVAHGETGVAGSAVCPAAFTIYVAVSATNAPVTAFALEPAWPNPAPGHARIRFAIPREAQVRLSVLDVQGREVAVLAEGVHGAGRHTVEWNGRGERGGMPPGLYLVRLVTPGGTFVRRLAVVL